MRKLNFEQACKKYPQRFTAEHVPEWASEPAHNELYPGPQYETDLEWYNHSVFPGEPEHTHLTHEPNSRFQTFPYGRWLKAPFTAKPITFTEGPWYAGKDKSIHGYPTWRIDARSLALLAVLTFESEQDRDTFGEKNARLIAAAPDMYEALQKILTEMGSHLPSTINIANWCECALQKAGK